jgi:DNA transformation protein
MPPETPTPVSSIRNLGPAYEKACSDAGIHSAQELHALGAHAAYRKLMNHGMRPHFIGYYALVMALQGRPWNDCKGAEKEALRLKFDSLKSSHKTNPESALEAMLNTIGTGETR